MTTVIDNELWDELRTDIPPPPPTRFADLTENGLIRLFCDTEGGSKWNGRAMDVIDLREMAEEFRRRGWDNIRIRGLVE